MEAQNAEIRNLYFRSEDRRFNVLRTTDPEQPVAVIVSSEDATGGVVKELFPYAEIEINDQHNESSFVLRILEKSKDVVDQHPKSTVFTVSAVVTGVATGIITYRRRKQGK